MQQEEKQNEIYDRQIRLWGLEAQKRMSSAKVFFGGMNTLNSEVCKNLVLAGVGVTLQDTQTVTSQDAGCQFIFNEQDVGQNRARVAAVGMQELNTLVEVAVEERPLEDLPEDFFGAFQVVCLSGATKQTQLQINQICRKQGSAFYSSGSFGFDGWIFCDLNHHEYQEDSVAGKPGAVCAVDYSSLEHALSTPWSSLADRFGPPPKALIKSLVLHDFQQQYNQAPVPGNDQDFENLKSLTQGLLKSNGLEIDFITDEDLRHLQDVGAVELTPVCAILGGILGQEVIKAISGKGEPINNMFVLSGLIGEGKVIKMPKT